MTFNYRVWAQSRRWKSSIWVVTFWKSILKKLIFTPSGCIELGIRNLNLWQKLNSFGCRDIRDILTWERNLLTLFDGWWRVAVPWRFLRILNRSENFIWQNKRDLRMYKIEKLNGDLIFWLSWRLDTPTILDIHSVNFLNERFEINSLNILENSNKKLKYF